MKDGETFNEASIGFFDRIARVMQIEEKGKKREIEIILGVGEKLPVNIDSSNNQSLRQVALFVTELTVREVDGSAISIGLSPGDEGNIVMFLTLRSVDEFGVPE